MKVVIDSY